jgi:hypothetical protein
VPSANQGKNQNPIKSRTGQVNQLNMAETPEREPIFSGMFSMNEHPVFICITPDSGTQLEILSSSKDLSDPSSNVPPSTHKLTAKKLEDIPVVKEFPDVFPDDLLGMPPDRDIKFKIEFVPGTVRISRRPYKWHQMNRQSSRFS